MNWRNALLLFRELNRRHRNLYVRALNVFALFFISFYYFQAQGLLYPHLSGFFPFDISISLLLIMLICVAFRLKLATSGWFILFFLSFIFSFICATNIYHVPTTSHVLLSMFIYGTNSLGTLQSVQTNTLFNNKQKIQFYSSLELQLASELPWGTFRIEPRSARPYGIIPAVLGEPWQLEDCGFGHWSNLVQILYRLPGVKPEISFLNSPSLHFLIY